jgi:hypothetical protein
VLSNIQDKYWKHNTKHGIFSITWNNAIVPQAFTRNYNSYCNIYLVGPHVWMEDISSGKYKKWKIYIVKNICRKTKNSHENGDDEKR